MDKKAGDSRFRLEASPSSLDAIQEGEFSQGSKCSISSKRAAQNRTAQRAFRQRKEQHVRYLETRAKQYELLVANNEKLRAENKHLWDLINQVQAGRDIYHLRVPEKSVMHETVSHKEMEDSFYMEDEKLHNQNMDNSSIETRSFRDPFGLPSSSTNNENVQSVNNPRHLPFFDVNSRRQGSDLNFVTSGNPSSPSSNPSTFPYGSNHHIPVSDKAHTKHVSAQCASLRPDNTFTCYTPTDVELKNGPSQADTKASEPSQIMSPNTSEYSPTPYISSTSTAESPEYTNLDEPKLAFLQYGWIYDPAIVQTDYNNSYCEMTGISPEELSFNDRVMDNLYSLLAMNSPTQENAASVSPQHTELVRII
ncbi:hypothetical protein K7432_008474 [Basidiobolus ranarum]|uniref:BZIP domain-containing protein n=1 Tax=Basidiobolus ranarum TaxID=34480 RepID=A0ABR2WRT8_9FUNG